MKYILSFILALSFVSPSVAMQDKEIPIGEISKQAMSAYRAGEFSRTVSLIDQLIPFRFSQRND